MTREEFWEIVMKLVRKDYWDAQSVPSKEVEDILSNSLLIPKPKFKKGDKVTDKDEYPYWVNECFYDLLKNEWWYVSRHGERVYESELELAKRKEE